MSITKTQALFDRALDAHKKEQFQKAISLYKEVLKLEPIRNDAMQNLASALSQKGQFEASKLLYEKLLKQNPNQSGVWSNYGNLLHKMELYSDAESAHEKAIKLEHRNAGHWYNAGNIPFSTNQPQLAISRYNESLKLEPNYHKSKWNRSLCLLQLEQWQQGFNDYETRLILYPETRSNARGKKWSGEHLKDKTILLTCEQGFGDMIQWARFVCLLKEQYQCQVILECREEIKSLMQFISGVDATVSKGGPYPKYDFHFPLMSLPSMGKWNSSKFLGCKPYLHPTYSEDWQLLESIIKIKSQKKPKVGIIWKSKPTPYDRSCKLADLTPLFELSDSIQFYSLQFGKDNNELYETGMDFFVEDVSKSIRSFSDTARLMQEMDLIITVDSASAHLAGALGLPCWVMLLEYADWRWGLDKSVSAWYPNTRLFRQQKHGEWHSVVANMACELQRTFLQK